MENRYFLQKISKRELQDYNILMKVSYANIRKRDFKQNVLRFKEIHILIKRSIYQENVTIIHTHTHTAPPQITKKKLEHQFLPVNL